MLSKTDRVALRFLNEHGETRFSHSHEAVNCTSTMVKLSKLGLITVRNAGVFWNITEAGKRLVESDFAE